MSLLGKLGYNISKGVCNFLAPLTAVSSMAGEGGDGVMDNLAAIYHAPKTIYEVGKAFALDEGIRSTGFKVMQELSDVVGSGVENMVERPVETLATAAGVWAGTKYMPNLGKGIKWAYKKIRPKEEV